MQRLKNITRNEWLFITNIALLLTISIYLLNSLVSYIFPVYYIYIFVAVVLFIFFYKIGFEIVSAFSPIIYFLSIIFIIIPLIIGQVTRGAVRWIPIGGLTILPSEIVRPFLLIFYANYLTKQKINIVVIVKALFLLFLPVFLIFIQPSLGVALLTIIGFLGIVIATKLKKRYILIALILVFLAAPFVWLTLKPYQKARIVGFVSSYSDPKGGGYNSIQSMITVGSGGVIGAGLKRGTQTQLKFLPEKQTDFIFAASAEELGFIGASILISLEFLLLWQLTNLLKNTKNLAARAYLSGVFFILFSEIFIHIGMNMGLLPITGVNLPLVSAGGSALLSTMITLALSMSSFKKENLSYKLT